MLKKLYIFMLMFLFIPSITVSAELVDDDTANTWIKNGFTIYSDNDIASSQLFLSIDYTNLYYDNKYVYDATVGQLTTDVNDLFEAFKEFHFYLANNNIAYGLTNYYDRVDDAYYVIDFDYTAGLLEMIIYHGSDPNNLTQRDYHTFTLPDVIPPVFFIHFDFEYGTFRFFWGEELLTENISLYDFENFYDYDDNKAAYNMTFAAYDRTNQPVQLFNGSDWEVKVSSSPTILFEYYNRSQEFYNSYAKLGLDNYTPTENNGAGVFDAFDRLFIGIGLIDATINYDMSGNYIGYTVHDTAGMVILYVILLLIFMYLIRKINGSTMPMLIVAILLTSVFMFLGYMPLFVSIILIGFFIVTILSMNKGGMLVE